MILLLVRVLAAAILRKAAVSFVVSVCPYAWKNADRNGTVFMEFRILSIFFRKTVETIQVSLKCDKNKKYFNPLKSKHRPLYLKTQSVPRCKHFSSRL